MPTLTANAAMKARLEKVAPAPRPAPPPPAQQPKPARLTIVPPPAVEDPELEARRRARHQRQDALLVRLRELSPDLFAAMPPVPLAIGINTVIVERLELDSEGAFDLGQVLRRHIYRPSYQRALIAEGAVRRDLEGTPAGLVTLGQRAKAIKTLAEIKAKQKARRAEETGG